MPIALMHQTTTANYYSALCVLGILLFAVSVCANSQPPAQQYYSVTDYNGREIVLAAPAQRIVALAPHIVENMFSAGAGDLLVGVVDYSDFPEAAKTIHNVGSIQGTSIEAIIALKPDLVIGWASGHSSTVQQKLTALGLTVYMDEPKKLEDVARSIKDIGVLTNRHNTAESAAREYLDQLTKLRAAFQQVGPVSVLYQVWNNPLQTINGKHIISDVIRLCGGYNIFAEAAVIAPKISIESVIELNPQAIVASGMGVERPDWLDDWQQWQTLRAVKNQHLFFIPPDLLQRHTVRILQGAERLCEQLEQVRRGNNALENFQ